MNGKYHRDIGFPEVEIPSGTYYLKYSGHALMATEDRYGDIPILNRLSIAASDVFEIVVQYGRVVKFAVRLPYRNGLDLTLVLTDNGRVVTQWFNKSDDNHGTLNPLEYDTP